MIFNQIYSQIKKKVLNFDIANIGVVEGLCHMGNLFCKLKEKAQNYMKFEGKTNRRTVLVL